jgi:hypothetical protein
MIDRTPRKQMANAIRGFATGRITNDEMESRYPQSNDPVIFAIEGYAWTLFDDLKVHRARGRHKLSKSEKKTIARCILFLKSDEQYEYPHFNPYGATLLDGATLLAPFLFAFNVFTLGLFHKSNQRNDPIEEAGDTSVWPFVSRKQLGRVSQELLYD